MLEKIAGANIHRLTGFGAQLSTNTFTLITSSLGFTFNICAILAFGYDIIRQLFCVTDNIVCFVYLQQIGG
ncbi:hypothetical protein, partial [Escherichia coli]